jgi:hypothetical protein
MSVSVRKEKDRTIFGSGGTKKENKPFKGFSRLHIVFVFLFVYYESIKRKLKTKYIWGCCFSVTWLPPFFYSAANKLDLTFSKLNMGTQITHCSARGT